jgi:6-phosphogluconolactonase
MVDVFAFDQAEELHTAVAEYLLSGVQAFHDYVPEVHVSLTGGNDGTTTSLEFLRALAAAPLSGIVHLWWSDERFVELNDVLRNDLAVVNAVDAANLHDRVRIHRAPAPSQFESLDAAAQQWAREIAEIEFAFAVVGVGPDGHIASLFPGLWNIHEQAEAIAISNSPKPPAQRVSFSFTTIADAANIVVVASGESKAQAISQAVDGNQELPITALVELEQTSLWLDAAAVSLLTEETEQNHSESN